MLEVLVIGCMEIGAHVGNEAVHFPDLEKATTPALRYFQKVILLKKKLFRSQERQDLSREHGAVVAIVGQTMPAPYMRALCSYNARETHIAHLCKQLLVFQVDLQRAASPTSHHNLSDEHVFNLHVAL